MPRPLAQYLARFGPDQKPHAAEDFPAGGPWPELPELPLDADAADDRLEAAREKAFAEGFAAGRGLTEQELAKARAAHEAQLADERRSWVNQEGERLAIEFFDALRKIELELADKIEKVLRPFIFDALREKILQSFMDHITMLLRGASQPLIVIQGPEDLVASLRERLSGLCASIEFSSAPAIEVKAVTGHTMIETQFSAWMARIEAEKS
ncbi:MAG TPA: hypothetical protein VFG05_11055 [Methylocella sp.]|nr:hypothetical protein [Methylocella sp.]